jgi:rifampicin phosphotransferase
MNGHNDVWTRDLRDIGRHDLALVGGKGANLGELLRAGFAVPPGFCVTTAAFAAVVAALPAVEVHMQTFEALTLANAEQVRALAGEIRTLLAHAPIPQEIEEAILAAWRAHGDQYAYGVRSSATAEDLPQASFAGQQDTILNVRGEGALLDAVRRCWASLWSDRATLYRMEQGFRHRDVRLAVVVQRMVVPDVAGIMFTADPVSNNYHIITIDASYGLGEALVSGIVSADGYRVDARTGRILARDIADKRVQVRELPEAASNRWQSRARRALVPCWTTPRLRVWHGWARASRRTTARRRTSNGRALTANGSCCKPARSPRSTRYRSQRPPTSGCTCISVSAISRS